MLVMGVVLAIGVIMLLMTMLMFLVGIDCNHQEQHDYNGHLHYIIVRSVISLIPFIFPQLSIKYNQLIPPYNALQS